METALDTRRALERGKLLLLERAREARKKNLPTPRLNLPSIIWVLIEEAVDTERRIVDPEHRFLSAGNRISWPMVLDEILFENEREKISEGEKTDQDRWRDYVMFRRMALTDRTAETRMYIVMGWMQFINGHKADRDRMLIWKMAEGTSNARLYALAGRPRSERQALWIIKQRALQKICSGVQKMLEC